MKQYLDLLRHVIQNGEEHHDRTGVGTLSVFGYQMRVDLRRGFPLLTTKKLPLRWIFEELRWFLSGDTDERNLRAAGVDIWKEWATPEQCARFDRREGDLGPVYGFLWRSFGGVYEPIHNRTPTTKLHGRGGVDQIARLIRDIQHNPGSRRHIVTGWDPREANHVALPPCHTLWQMKVHEHKQELSCHLYARSIDSFLGLPFNIASYALLTELVAAVTGLTARDLVISFGDLHIYLNNLDAVEEQLSRETRTLPRLYVADPRDELHGLEGLLKVRWENLHLEGYQPHAKISAPVAV